MPHLNNGDIFPTLTLDTVLDIRARETETR
jgi:hypothetical protein